MPKDRPLMFKLKIKEKPNNSEKSTSILRYKLKNDETLRKVFLNVAKYEPCRISEIQEDLIVVKQTAYNKLKTLVNFKVIEKLPIIEVITKDKKNFIERKIIEKFEDWTSKMPKTIKSYYQSRTNYYFLTEFGETFIEWACKFEGIEFEKINVLEKFVNES